MNRLNSSYYVQYRQLIAIFRGTRSLYNYFGESENKFYFPRIWKIVDLLFSYFTVILQLHPSIYLKLTNLRVGRTSPTEN